MQSLISTLGRLSVVIAGALALGSCSRSNYAFLPKADSYLGTTAAAPKARPQAPAVAATPAAEVAPQAEASPAIAPEVTVATAPVVAAKPAAAPTAVAAEPAAAAAAPAATVATPAPQKLSLVQRMALAKVTKKMNKLASKSSQFKQGDNTASTARGAINGNLKIGIVLLLIGLLLSLINGLIGTIVAIIGLIFIVLWLLDQI